MMSRFLKQYSPYLKPRLALLFLIIAAFLPTWEGLSHIWSHTFGYAHGWLIALISLGLLLSDKTPLHPAKRSYPALLFLFAALVLWALARFSFTDLAEELMLPVLCVAVTYSLYGFTAARSVAFASFYILFAVPIWDYLIPFLQTATVFGVTHALSLIGISNLAHGNYINIEFGTFHVERGCSGANFVIVAIAVACLNARTWALPLRKSIFAIAFATVLSVLANWVRVFVIVLQAWRTDMQTTLIRNHYWFGWYLFAGALIVYFIVTRYLDEGRKPVTLTSSNPNASRTDILLQTVLTTAMLFAVSLYTQARLNSLSALTSRLRAAPVLNGTWSGPHDAQTRWYPEFPGAKAHSVTLYQKSSGRHIAFYRALYTNEREGSKMIGWGISVVPPHWKILKQTYITVNKHASYISIRHPAVQWEAMDREGSLWLIWSWYKIGHTVEAKPLAMKLAQGLELFTFKPIRPSETIVLATPCYAKCAQARLSLLNFDEKELTPWN